MAFTLFNNNFNDRETIPKFYTCEGADVSPKLSWSGVPHGTKSFTLIMHDPDAPMGDYTHWILTDIPATVDHLPEATPVGHAGVDHVNSFGKMGYGGPCPPTGHGPHRYYFELSAVDVESIGVPRGSSREQVDAALAGHVIATTLIVGTYERK